MNLSTEETDAQYARVKIVLKEIEKEDLLDVFKENELTVRVLYKSMSNYGNICNMLTFCFPNSSKNEVKF